MKENKTGEYIKVLRERMGYTQEQLAEMVGVSIQSISNWERGKSEPKIDNYNNLARIFNVTVTELANGADMPPMNDANKAYLDKTVSTLLEKHEELAFISLELGFFSVAVAIIAFFSVLWLSLSKSLNAAIVILSLFGFGLFYYILSKIILKRKSKKFKAQREESSKEQP